MIKNIFSNFVGRVWSLISVFIFIPLYIHFLGIELYGLVSFFATMQSLLFLLDAGLSATLRREFSAGEQSIENKRNKYKLLRSIEFCYLIICLCIVSITFFSAGTIVNKWLNLGSIEKSIAISAIRLMGMSIALQFLSSLYFGGLLGLEKQVTANAYQIGWSVLKSGCVILILWLIAPDIRLFYLWFIISDSIYLISLRFRINKELIVDGSFAWKIKELGNLRDIWKYATGIFAISILSTINFQMDKIIISKVLPISDLGIYNMAFSLSQLPLILINAVAIAIFARFVYYFSVNERQKQQNLFLFAYRITGIIAISISISMCFYTQELFQVWAGNLEITTKAWVPAIILISGSMLLTFQIIPFNLVLSHGVTKINTVFGIMNLMVLLPSLFFLVSKYGIIGAALSCLLMNLVITPFYNCYVYDKYISRHWLKWFMTDTIIPLIFIVSLTFVFFMIGKRFDLSSGIRVLYAVIAGTITMVIAAFLFISDLRSRVQSVLKEIFY